ncbi:unnamed protein product, partial [Bubo scandiacus]
FNYMVPTNREICKDKETDYFLTINTCNHQRPVAEFKKKKKKKERKERQKVSFKETWSQAHILFLPLGAEVRALDKTHFSSLYRTVD